MESATCSSSGGSSFTSAFGGFFDFSEQLWYANLIKYSGQTFLLLGHPTVLVQGPVDSDFPAPELAEVQRLLGPLGLGPARELDETEAGTRLRVLFVLAFWQGDLEDFAILGHPQPDMFLFRLE
jgi:hypothetical protein